jgi:hypothetical protein
VHALAIFDVVTLVDIDKIAKLDAKIVTCNLVYLYATFLNIIGAQTDEDCVPPLLPAKTMCEVQVETDRVMDEPNDDCVPAVELKIFHCNRVECGNCKGVSGYDNAYASEDMPELSSEVASSTIRRLGLETQR